MWYSWTSQHDFDEWHLQVISDLNLPRVGHNAATGQPEPDKQLTTAYTAVRQVADDDWRAKVDDEVAQTHSNGLGTPCSPPPTPPLPWLPA